MAHKNKIIENYYKEWALETKPRFERSDEWVGDVVKGFTHFCLDEEDKKVKSIIRRELVNYDKNSVEYNALAVLLGYF